MTVLLSKACSQSAEPRSVRFLLHRIALNASIVVGLITLALQLGCTKNSDHDNTPTTSPESTVSTRQTTESNVSAVQHHSPSIDPQLPWPSLFGPHGDAAVDHPVELASLPWKELWRIDCGSGYSSAVANVNQVFVQGRIGDEEMLWSVDQESGQIQWVRSWPTAFVCEFDYSSGPASTPLLAYGSLYAIGAEGRFTAFDPATGETRWERDLRTDYDAHIGPWGFGSSPIAIPSQIPGENLILVMVGGASSQATLVAFHASDGTEKWRAGDENGSYSTPKYFHYNGHNFASVLTEESLLLVDIDAQEITTQLAYRSKIVLQVNATTPVWYRDRLIVSAYGLGSAAFRIDDQRQLIELWNDRRGLDSQYNVLVPHDNDLLGFSSRVRELRRMNLDDGSERWGWYSTVGRGNVIKVGEEFVLLGEGGDLTVLRIDSTGCQPVGEPMSAGFQDRCFSTPVFVNGMIIVRGEGGLVAYQATR